MMAESPEHLSSRKEEILALTSIYDELILNSDRLSGSLTIPVKLDAEITINSPGLTEKVRFLLGVEFHFATGEKYPEDEPPSIQLRCPWLSADDLVDIENEVKSLWTNEFCLFTMIDEVSERAKSAFGKDNLTISSEEAFWEILDFAEREEMELFNDSVFYCEICLEHKKGTKCYKLPRCGHVSCKECLKDYYGMCITEGLVNQVTCINSACAKSLTTPPRPKTKEDQQLLPFLYPLAHLPSTLTDIFPDNPDIVARYIRLVKQKFYERSTTVYCPRENCQTPVIPKDPDIQIIVCPRCTYPFCKLCRAAWHGEEARCKLPFNGVVEKYLASPELERTVMERMYGKKILNKLVEAFQRDAENEAACEKYIREHTTCCPTCTAPFQKSFGCNKMTCVTCGTKFCYLCGKVLNARNPYIHYSLDDPGASKTCRGLLFHGVDEYGAQVELRNDILRERLQIGQNDWDDPDYEAEDE